MIYNLKINLIDKLKLLGDCNNDNKFNIKLYNLNNYLKLDSGAFHSLNLLPSNRGDQQSSSSKTHSVYGVLNKVILVIVHTS
jgi:hypothetical protein